MKRIRVAAIIGAVVIAGGLAFAGSASAAPAAVAGDTTTATVATPAGSFHIPVVPYTGSSSTPFSGSLNTLFTMYTLPTAPAGSVFYEAFVSTPGVEGDYSPPLGSTVDLFSDTAGDLFGNVGPNGQVPSFTNVDFSTSGLNGLVTAAGDYSIGVKFLSNTGVTGVWWTTVHFDAPVAATSTTTPSWEWDHSSA